MIGTLAPDEKVAKFAAYSALVTSDRWGREVCSDTALSTLFLPCLAPLFRRFRSPVRGLRRDVTEPRNHLTFLVFCVDFARHVGRRRVFPLLFGLKQGSALLSAVAIRVRRVTVNARRGWSSQCRISFRGRLCVTIERYRARLKGGGDKPASGFPAIPLAG
jgi:hypothetical protein